MKKMNDKYNMTKDQNIFLAKCAALIFISLLIKVNIFRMFADISESFLVLLDEPENHLHPELQKSFLGNLIKAFPNVQFIVATHNPFMITSQKDSNVYVLDYNDKNIDLWCVAIFSE